MGVWIRLLSFLLILLGVWAVPAAVALLLAWGLPAAWRSTGIDNLSRERLRGACLDARRNDLLRLQEVQQALFQDIVERAPPLARGRGRLPGPCRGGWCGPLHPQELPGPNQ
jgi:hypothetical protein